VYNIREMKDDSVKIYTDGSSRGNPGPGGYGAIVISKDSVFEIGGKEDTTTNNRMEILSAIEALGHVLNSMNDVRKVIIYSDSAYLVNGATQWLHGWKIKNWVTASKSPVLNKDLWERLDTYLSKLSVVWEKVAGHSGHMLNERADEIATSFALNLPTELYRGTIESYIPLRSGNSKSKTLYACLVDGKEAVLESWKECSERVHGKSGARWKKVRNKTEAENQFRLWRDS
jgi:ribonuclease HI